MKFNRGGGGGGVVGHCDFNENQDVSFWLWLRLTTLGLSITSWSQVGIFLPAYIDQICEYVCLSNNVNKWISWSQTTLDLYVVVLSSTKLNYYCHSQIRLLWWLRFGGFAKLSLSFSFSLTEQVIASANPNTQHPDKYKFLSYSWNMKCKVVWIDVMSFNMS